ncbi:hypothetical protein BHM03_00019488 [Ensete ventricosum]|nr:hypothetical protein BHM03_00019488 [Ensete ventricosum]
MQEITVIAKNKGAKTAHLRLPTLYSQGVGFRTAPLSPLSSALLSSFSSVPHGVGAGSTPQRGGSRTRTQKWVPKGNTNVRVPRQPICVTVRI